MKEKQRRSDGALTHWASYRAEMQNVIDTLGHFPTETELRSLGHSSLASRSRLHGGLSVVRTKMGYAPLKRSRGSLKVWADFEAQMRQVVGQLGHFPTTFELKAMKCSSLTSAAIKYFGGLLAVREKMGYEVAARPPGTLQVWENFEAEMQRIIIRLGHFPTQPELKDIGESSLVSAAAAYYGGYAAVRVKMGYAALKRRHGMLRDWPAFETEMRRFINQLGHFPTDRELDEVGEHSLASAAQKYHGGMSAVRRRLGYQPIKRAAGILGNWAGFANEMCRVIGQIGHFPTAKELNLAGEHSLMSAAQRYHGGLAAVRVRLGYEPNRRPRGMLQDWAKFEAEMRRIIGQVGHFPTAPEMRQLGEHSMISVACRSYGGLTAVAARLGYAPTTQDHIQQHLGEIIDVFLATQPEETLEAFLARIREDYPTEGAFTAWLQSQQLKT